MHYRIKFQTKLLYPGFFNTSSVTNDVCIGNLVSDSEIIHRSPKKKLNANFGVLKNGSIFTGFI